MDPRAPALLMTTQDDGEAEIVRGLLESYDIPVQVISDIVHSVSPITVDGLGEVRILVPADQLEEARGILAEHERQGLSGTEDGLVPESAGDQGPGTGPARS